jgi:hypothetical protein
MRNDSLGLKRRRLCVSAEPDTVDMQRSYQGPNRLDKTCQGNRYSNMLFCIVGDVINSEGMIAEASYRRDAV